MTVNLVCGLFLSWWDETQTNCSGFQVRLRMKSESFCSIRHIAPPILELWISINASSTMQGVLSVWLTPVSIPRIMPGTELRFSECRISEWIIIISCSLLSIPVDQALCWVTLSILQDGGKVGLQLWVHEIQSLFLCYLLLYYFSIQTTINLVFPHPVFLILIKPHEKGVVTSFT